MLWTTVTIKGAGAADPGVRAVAARKNLVASEGLEPPPLTTVNQNQRQGEATYGAGVQWTFAPHCAVFAEWIKKDRIDVDSYVGGVDFRF